MSFAAYSLHGVRTWLDGALERRLRTAPGPQQGARLCHPVALLFVRGDREGPGKDIIEQVVASYPHWNDESFQWLDVIFPGWAEDVPGSPPTYNSDRFRAFRDEVQARSAWAWSGETDALVIDYEFTLPSGPGEFSFRHCLEFPVETLIRDKRTPHLDAFVHDLTEAARATWPRTEQSAVAAMSAELIKSRGMRSLAEVLGEKPLLKDAAKVYRDLSHFAYRDLSLK